MRLILPGLRPFRRPPFVASVADSPGVTAVTGLDGSFTSAIELGFRFTAAANFTLTQLARYKFNSGDNQSLVTSLYNSSSALLGSVSINATGVTNNTFAYGSITPVSITSGSQYFIITAYDGGGDHWTNNGCTITVDAAAISAKVASTRSGGTCSAGSGQTYGPVGFKYH